jgi:DNA-binding NarL/FixJ family response regulator
MRQRLRVILVDDHEVVRLGLRAILDERAEFTVVDEASTAAEAIRKTEANRPDVVVMDVRLPGDSGIDACREITRRVPEVKVIMLTSYADPEFLADSIAAGATGYLLKQTAERDLVNALEAVARGESVLDRASLEGGLERMGQKSAEPEDQPSAS